MPETTTPDGPGAVSTDRPSDVTVNPYDREDTCRCSAWSEGECGCGGYVDLGKVRAWQQGFDAALAWALG
jgi:hypothetical protein